jgi:hypothetical protein
MTEQPVSHQVETGPDRVTYEDRTREMLAQSGQSTLNALLFMNGGAVAAFLTFLTPLIQTGKVQAAFIAALTSFIYGLLSVVVAFGTIHLCILASRFHYNKAAHWLYGATVVFSLGSAVGFMYGVWRALGALQSA